MSINNLEGGEKVWSSYLSYEKTAKNITPFEGLYYRIISWLGIADSYWLFPDEIGEDNDTKCHIQEIRELLGEDKNGTK